MNGKSKAKVYFPLLDLLRGLAALLVFAEHWRNFLFEDYSQLENPGLAFKLFYVFTGAGREAVMIFFVLSGCVIAHVIQTLHESGRWSWRVYLTARLSRLWIVLIPALVLTAFWDHLGMHLSKGDGSIYTGQGFGNMMNDAVADKVGLDVWLGNVFFLQTVFVPTFGSNVPLWSIAYEFVYYLVYPLLFLTVCPKTPLRLRPAFLVTAALLLMVAGKSILGLFPIWLAGAMAYGLFRKKPAAPRLALAGFLMGGLGLVTCVMGSRANMTLPFLSWNGLLAVSTAFTIYFGMSVEIKSRLKLILRPFELLSSISYSLYLLHMPVLTFLVSLLFTNDSPSWPLDGKHLAIGLLLAGLVFAYCILIWSFTERKTPQIRDWIKARRKA